MTVDAAVVGAGNVSDVHLSAARRSPRSRLVAVCDPDPERARRAATEYGVPSYGEVGRLLTAEQPDLVHICTPVQEHLPVSREAVRAGAAILVEKPVTTTVGEFRELRELVRTHDVRASVVHQSQFGPAMRRARALVRHGKLGTVQGGDLIYTGAPRPDAKNRGEWVSALPGGEFEETLPHPLYLGLNAGYPRDEDEVDVTTTCRREYDHGFAYDGVQLQYTTTSGGLASLKIMSGGHTTRLLHLHGDDGAIRVDFRSQTVTHSGRAFESSPSGRARRALSECTASLRDLARNGYLVGSHRVRNDWAAEKRVDPHADLIDRMYRAVEDDTAVPVPLAEAGWTVRMLGRVRSAAGREPGQVTTSD